MARVTRDKRRCGDRTYLINGPGRSKPLERKASQVAFGIYEMAMASNILDGRVLESWEAGTQYPPV